MRILFSLLILVALVSAVHGRDATFDTLVKRIERLEERDLDQQNKINRLEKRDTIQLERIAHLEERERLQKDEIGVLTERALAQKDEIKELRELLVQKTNTPFVPNVRFMSDNVPIEARKSQGRTQVVNIPVELATRNARAVNRNQRKSVDRTRRAENEMDVAFFATLSSHQTHTGVNQPILFDHVITNIGNAYHNNLGSFIAPVSGTYVFSTSLLTWGNKYVHYAFSKNGVAVSNIFLDARTSGYESTSQTVILALNQNDDVTIRNSLDADSQTHGGHYSNFAGFLLQSHYPDAIVG